MSAFNAIVGLLTRAWHGPRRVAMMVRIDDEVAGTAFGWGPERDDFIAELARITQGLGGRVTHWGRVAGGYQLAMIVARRERWLEDVQALMRSSGIGVAVSVFAGSRDGTWKNLELEEGVA